MTHFRENESPAHLYIRIYVPVLFLFTCSHSYLVINSLSLCPSPVSLCLCPPIPRSPFCLSVPSPQSLCLSLFPSPSLPHLCLCLPHPPSLSDVTHVSCFAFSHHVFGEAGWRPSAV